MPRHNLVEQAQSFIGAALGAGDIAIDATVGNGFDTLFLARQVGARGQVFGFDIQAQALSACREKLRAAGQEAVVTLLPRGHETMAQALPAAARGRVRAVMFNLGYLPGSDKALITRPETSLAAIEAALALMAPGGRMSIIAYTGHSGGETEADQVQAWLERHLSADAYEWQCRVPQQTRQRPPRLITLEKMSAKCLP